MLYKMVLCMCVVAATAFQAPASKLGMSAVRATAAPATRFASAVVMDEVEDKVKGIIAEQLGVEAGSVKPDSSFTEDLGADSLDAVELIMAIEEAFDIEIPDEEAETMTTPKECVAAIKAKLSGHRDGSLSDSLPPSPQRPRQAASCRVVCGVAVYGVQHPVYRLRCFILTKTYMILDQSVSQLPESSELG
eukprot:scaffold33503_cov48-Phaeocystis_antarctica.AAC.2